MQWHSYGALAILLHGARLSWQVNAPLDLLERSNVALLPFCQRKLIPYSLTVFFTPTLRRQCASMRRIQWKNCAKRRRWSKRERHIKWSSQLSWQIRERLDLGLLPVSRVLMVDANTINLP